MRRNWTDGPPNPKYAKEYSPEERWALFSGRMEKSTNLRSPKWQPNFNFAQHISGLPDDDKTVVRWAKLWALGMERCLHFKQHFDVEATEQWYPFGRDHLSEPQFIQAVLFLTTYWFHKDKFKEIYSERYPFLLNL